MEAGAHINDIDNDGNHALLLGLYSISYKLVEISSGAGRMSLGCRRKLNIIINIIKYNNKIEV